MFEKKGRTGRRLRALLVFLCIILLGAFVGMLYWDRLETSRERERLEKLATKEDNAGISDYEEVKARTEQRLEDAAAEEETQTEVKKDSKESSGNKTDEENQEKKEENNAVQTSGISCWGDDLLSGTESETYSYMFVLQKLLAENGYDIPVFNKTLQGGGTLSMMKRAGVSDGELQAYINAHRQAANGAQLNVTETGIRDFTEEELVRDDADCIPIIFMGYYGGWNHSPEELAEQQEKILNTFSDKERFIIVGTKPLDSIVDPAALDAVLGAKWGEHYISLLAISEYPASRYETQAAMAQSILDKMIELGYISK